MDEEKKVERGETETHRRRDRRDRMEEEKEVQRGETRDDREMRRSARWE